MKKQTMRKGKTLPRIAALGLAGAVLWGGSALPVSAATLKDLFDEHYYADTYKDLRETFGYDREALWNHYMQYGFTEGRTMNELLDVVKYKEQYADLSNAFGNNWDAYVNHYLTFGVKERRDSGTGTEFNALDYADRYTDLQAAFGNDVLALWKHYQTFGAEEGREARSEEVLEAEREAEAAAEREAAEKADTSEGYTKHEYNAANQLIKNTFYDKDGNITQITDLKYTDGKVTESVTHFLDKNSPMYGMYNILKNLNDKQENVLYHQNDMIAQTTDYIYSSNTRILSYYRYDENWVLTSIYSEKGTGSNTMPFEEFFFYPDGRYDHYTFYYNGKMRGDTVYIYEDGKIVASETKYSDGRYAEGKYNDNEQLIETINYYEDGRIYYIFDHTTKPLTNSEYCYNENKVLEKVQVIKGQGLNAPLLKETFYDADGNEEYYTVYTYDEDGKLKSTESFNADGSARE